MSDDHSHPRRSWFRFSLRTMFVLVTGCDAGLFAVGWAAQEVPVPFVNGRPAPDIEFLRALDARELHMAIVGGPVSIPAFLARYLGFRQVGLRILWVGEPLAYGFYALALSVKQRWFVPLAIMAIHFAGV